MENDEVGNCLGIGSKIREFPACIAPFNAIGA